MLIVGSGVRWRFVGWIDGEDLRDYYYRKNMPFWLPQNILQTATSRLDYLLLSGFCSVYELGVYDRVMQFVRIPTSLSINLLDRVLLASYSKEQNSPGALRATLAKARVLILGGATVATLATTLGIVLALDRLIGASWASAILANWWLAIPYALLVPLLWNNNILMQATGNPKYLILISLAATAGDLALGGLALAAGYRVSGLFVARSLVQVGVYDLQCALIRRIYHAGQPLSGALEGAGSTGAHLPPA